MLILMGLLVSLDACFISMINGIGCKYKLNKILLMVLIFSLFQGIMPFIGYFLWDYLEIYFINYVYYIQVFILGFIGCKMILDSIKDFDINVICNLDFKLIIIQGFAGSIDALIIGSTINLLNLNIIYSFFLFFIITFVLCIISYFIGNKLSFIFKNSKLIGGIILIIICLNILNKII